MTIFLTVKARHFRLVMIPKDYISTASPSTRGVSHQVFPSKFDLVRRNIMLRSVVVCQKQRATIGAMERC